MNSEKTLERESLRENIFGYTCMTKSFIWRKNEDVEELI